MTRWSLARGVEIVGEGEQAGPPRNGGELGGIKRWRVAEGRLYPLIMVDPDLYEAVVKVVSEVADELRMRCSGPTELIDIEPADVLASCPSAPAMATLGFDPGTAVDAARALLWRELAREQNDVHSAETGGLR